MKIPWRDYFDRIMVIRYTGYHAQRGGALERELARVGLAGVHDNIWTVPSPYMYWLAGTCRLARTGAGIEPFSLMVSGVYRAFKIALATGANRVLLMEDDVEFMSDLGMLDSALASIPKDAQVARMCWMNVQNIPLERTDTGWAAQGPHQFTDSGAACWSRPAMEHAVAQVERQLASGGVIGFADSVVYLPERNAGVYLAIPLVAIQREYRSKMCRKHSYDRWYRRYLASCGYGLCEKEVAHV